MTRTDGLSAFARPVWLAWRQTARLSGSHRRVWLPFLLVAGLEVIFLGLVWLAPHPPFSIVLAPPLRYFFGDRILHYPWHLWFLYHAVKHTQAAASLLLGAFMSGVACAMVRQTHEGQPLSFREALVSRQVRYGTVLLLWVVTWSSAQAIVRLVAGVTSTPAQALWSILAVTVLLQALLAYAIPAAVFERLPWWRALLQSVREALRYPLSTLGVIALPSAAVILWGLFVSEPRVMSWMERTAPEIAVALVLGRLAVVTVADACLTVGIAHLWWFHRTPQPLPVGAGARGPETTRGVVTLREGPAVA